MTTPIFNKYEADSIDFSFSVIFKPGSGPATLTGGTVGVDALNLDNGAKIAGVATISTDTTGYCLFAPWSLATGNWKAQIRANPNGFKERTIGWATFVIQASAHAEP